MSEATDPLPTYGHCEKHGPIHWHDDGDPYCPDCDMPSRWSRLRTSVRLAVRAAARASVRPRRVRRNDQS